MAFCSGISAAEPMTIDVSKSEKTEIVAGEWDGARDVEFTNRIQPYGPDVASRGLQFIGGDTFTITGAFKGSGYNGSPVVGVDSGVTLEFNGTFTADQGGAKPCLSLRRGGRFLFGADAVVDVIMNDAWFTRQIWVDGDGSGVLGFSEGFVADRSDAGDHFVPVGLGSYRLSNVILETNHSQSLPSVRRLDIVGGDSTYDKRNAHLVFEYRPGSIWRVLTSDQVYDGGLWCSVDVTVETRKNLELNGNQTHWSFHNYINYGGIHLTKDSVTVTKTGLGDLVLSGDQSYVPGSRMVVNEGAVFFRTDPFAESGKGSNPGQYLTVDVTSGGRAVFESDLNRIQSLVIAENGIAEVSITSSVQITDTLAVHGTLAVVVPEGHIPTAGDGLRIGGGVVREAPVDRIELPQLPEGLSWDTEQWSTQGEIIIRGSSFADRRPKRHVHGSPISTQPRKRLVPMAGNHRLRWTGISLRGRSYTIGDHFVPRVIVIPGDDRRSRD